MGFQNWTNLLTLMRSATLFVDRMHLLQMSLTVSVAQCGHQNLGVRASSRSFMPIKNCMLVFSTTV